MSWALVMPHLAAVMHRCGDSDEDVFAGMLRLALGLSTRLSAIIISYWNLQAKL